jgi:uncharacterized RDD family membrane protein YckC
MGTADSSFSWGSDTFARGDDGPRAKGSTRQESLLGARMAALIIDGLVLLVPVFLIAYLLSLAFRHHGFFVANSGATTTTTTASGISTTRYGVTLPLPGVLLICALSLSYFYICEAVWEQTVGKRVMGLRVRSSSGGPAGLNATAARTILRLIDGIAFYLVGWLVALLTGRRRRRIGDWAGRTVVVRSDDTLEHSPHPTAAHVALFPVVCVAGTLAVVFGLGVGTALNQEEQAVALVRVYVQARQQGNASLACSMLTSGEQREIVAIEGHSYATATAAQCPAFILHSEPDSHLLNPELSRLVELPLTGAPSPFGGVIVSSPRSSLQLIAVPEDGKLKLDMQGIQKLSFVRGCVNGSGHDTSAECSCTFDLARSQNAISETAPTPSELRILAEDMARCQSSPTIQS